MPKKNHIQVKNFTYTLANLDQIETWKKRYGYYEYKDFAYVTLWDSTREAPDPMDDCIAEFGYLVVNFSDSKTNRTSINRYAYIASEHKKEVLGSIGNTDNGQSSNNGQSTTAAKKQEDRYFQQKEDLFSQRIANLESAANERMKIFTENQKLELDKTRLENEYQNQKNSLENEYKNLKQQLEIEFERKEMVYQMEIERLERKLEEVNKKEEEVKEKEEKLKEKEEEAKDNSRQITAGILAGVGDVVKGYAQKTLLSGFGLEDEEEDENEESDLIEEEEATGTRSRTRRTRPRSKVRVRRRTETDPGTSEEENSTEEEVDTDTIIDMAIEHENQAEKEEN